jgi:hypothetical protein
MVLLKNHHLPQSKKQNSLGRYMPPKAKWTLKKKNSKRIGMNIVAETNNFLKTDNKPD